MSTYTPRQTRILRTLYGQAGEGTSLTPGTVDPWLKLLRETIKVDVPSEPCAWEVQTSHNLSSFYDWLQRIRELILEELQTQEPDEPVAPIGLVDDTAFHPGLWIAVKHSVEAEAWSAIPAIVHNFLERRFRDMMQYRLEARDEPRQIQDLIALAFSQDHYPLDSVASRRDGWRMLIQGFFLGPRNTDQHGGKVRADEKAYAVGVLATGSLILTQIAHMHRDRVNYKRRPPIGEAD